MPKATRMTLATMPPYRARRCMVVSLLRCFVSRGTPSGQGASTIGMLYASRCGELRSDPVLARVPHELGAAGAAALALDVRAVRLHRAHADEELRGDLGVRLAE